MNRETGKAKARPRPARLTPYAGLLLGLAAAACGTGPETVFTLSPPTWYEDGGSFYDIAPDGRWAIFRGAAGVRLIDLASRQADSVTYGSRAALLTAHWPEGNTPWGSAAGAGLPPAVPANAILERSPDGARWAYFAPGEKTLYLGSGEGLAPYQLDGSVTGIGWGPHSDLVYLLVFHADGLSTLDRINLETQAVQPIRDQLDAPPRGNRVAIAPDGRTVYLALAGYTAPAPAERHRPDIRRDTDIHALDLARDRLQPVARAPDEDIHPVTAGGFLYWTHNQFHDQVVVVPAGGGDARAVVEGGMIPYWSADGKRLAYTHGGYRLADWGLNLDAAVVELDDSARAVSAPEPIAEGFHEDFTPAWSPNGAWIAYHSHRSRLPAPSYDTPGHADDIFLRRPEAPMSEEIRLTDWGWETGMADWAPDGRHLVFDSWDQGGPPRVAKPWVVTIDTATGRLVDRRRLPLPPEVTGTRLASWSPGGDEIALIAEEASGRQALWVVSVEGRSFRRVVEVENPTYGGLDWTPDGESIVYGALVAGHLQLFRVGRAGGVAVQLTHDAANLAHPQVSPDGRWIAATRLAHEKGLRRLRL